MVTSPRTSLLRSALIPGAALVAAWALACGGGSHTAGRPTAPAAAAPRDVIAFGAVAGGGLVGGGHFGLYLVQPDGAGLRKLSDETGPISFPRWSPAGDRIAYIEGGATGSATTLRTFDFATGAARTLSEHALLGDLGAPLSWSPDGERLAFVEASGGGRLRIYDLKLNKLLDVVDVPAVAVDWSPAGDTLAVVRPNPSGQGAGIYSVKSDGSNAKLIIGGESLHGDPRWSPDGKRLASWSAPSAQLTAHTLALHQSNGDGLSDLGPGLDPSWSADGRLIYSRPASGSAGAAFDIYLLASEGGRPQLVTQGTTRDRWPVWSASADALAYLAQVDLTTAFLCTATLAQKESCLDLGSLVPSQPAWSPF
jgi:Tol biopolymer transport system component